MGASFFSRWRMKKLAPMGRSYWRPSLHGKDNAGKPGVACRGRQHTPRVML